jgi:hypothetical protein
MNIMRIIILVCALLINHSALAINIPSDFLYNDRLLDPNCILESNITHTINLKECCLHKGKEITSYTLENDTLGYNYINKENNYPGSIMYKYLGKIKELHVVHAFIIGGSVSRLNYINYFKINKDILKLVKRGPAGDRSLGGIYNAKIKNNSLTYDMSLTAHLFVKNFNKSKKRISFSEELSNCAICQFARVHYSSNKIKSITLNNKVNSYSNKQIEKCFNNIHSNFIKNNHLTLTPNEAMDFVNMFILKCTANK